MGICLRANESHSLNQPSLQLVVDYCVKNLCQNDAKCVNRETNYSCACNSSGWTGKYCEKGFSFDEKFLRGTATISLSSQRSSLIKKFGF